MKFKKRSDVNTEPTLAIAEAVTPDKIENMTDEEFDKYLENLPVRDEGETAAAAEEASEGTAQEPYLSFATKEEYEADRGSAIAEAIAQLKENMHKNEELLERIKRSASDFYPDEEEPVEAMLNDLDSQMAKRKGQSVEDWRDSREEMAEFEEFRRKKKESEARRKEEERIIEGWKRDSDMLRQLLPEFDLGAAMRDEVFSSSLRSGSPVSMAYLAMLLSKPAKDIRPPRREIAQNAQSANKGTGETTINPATLSSADFKQYIDRIRG